MAKLEGNIVIGMQKLRWMVGWCESWYRAERTKYRRCENVPAIS
jgi:hypothetical protein